MTSFSSSSIGVLWELHKPVNQALIATPSNPSPLFDFFSRQIDKVNQGNRPRKPQIKSTISFVRQNQKDFLKKQKKFIDEENWIGNCEIIADLKDCDIAISSDD